MICKRRSGSNGSFAYSIVLSFYLNPQSKLKNIDSGICTRLNQVSRLVRHAWRFNQSQYALGSRHAISFFDPLRTTLIQKST